MKIIEVMLIVMLAFATFCPQSLAGCQDEKKHPQPTEESIAALQEAMDGLTESLKDKEYSRATAQIDKISTKYVGGEKKQKEAAVSLLKGCLKNKDLSVRKSAISALGHTGGKAIKILMKGAKAAKKDPDLQQRYLNAAGKLRDESVIKDFLKYLNNKDNNIIKIVIYALGNYSESPTKMRKEIVKGLLKVYSSVASAYSKPNPTTTNKAKYDALYNPFESTLKKLTKQEIKGANEWNRWFRKDGKKRKEW